MLMRQRGQAGRWRTKCQHAIGANVDRYQTNAVNTSTCLKRRAAPGDMVKSVFLHGVSSDDQLTAAHAALAESNDPA